MQILKKSVLFLASFTFVLAGCSLGKDPNMTMSLDEAKKMSQENPAQLYYTLFSANAGYFTEKMEKYTSILPRYTSEIREKISFDLANTPLGGGKGSIDMQIQSEGDYQTKGDPKQKTTFTLVSDVMGGMVSTDIKATLLVLEKSLFLSFEKANISAMMMPAEFKTAIAGLLGKAYGNTWEEIKTSTNGELDLEKYFTSGGLIYTLSMYNKEVQSHPEQYMTFQKFIKEENGYFYFEALQSVESIKKSQEMLMRILPFGKTFEAAFTKAMNESNAIAPMPFIIAYHPENRTYFIQEFSFPTSEISPNPTKITITHTKEELSITMPVEDKVFSIAKKQAEIVGTMTENNTVYTFLQGTANKESVNISFLNPQDKSELAMLALKKSGKHWEGEMTFPILKTIAPTFESGKLVVSQAHISADHMSATLQAMLNNTEIAKSEIEYTLKKASGNLNLTKPNSFEPFSNLQSIIPVGTSYEENFETSHTQAAFSDAELKALEAELNALTPEEKTKIEEELKNSGIQLPQ